MKVGIKCSSECQLANQAFGILRPRGRTSSRRGRCPATSGPARQPSMSRRSSLKRRRRRASTRGASRFRCRISASARRRCVSVDVRVVCHHDCLVTVEAVDKDSRVPLPGARVVMHPFRAVTDERGFAELRVATGAYKLFVSQTRYLTFGLPVEVTADMTASAELCSSLSPSAIERPHRRQGHELRATNEHRVRARDAPSTAHESRNAIQGRATDGPGYRSTCLCGPRAASSGRHANSGPQGSERLHRSRPYHSAGRDIRQRPLESHAAAAGRRTVATATTAVNRERSM